MYQRLSLLIAYLSILKKFMEAKILRQWLLNATNERNKGRWGEEKRKKRKMKRPTLYTSPSDSEDTDKVFRWDRPSFEFFFYSLKTIYFLANDLRNIVSYHEQHNASSYYMSLIIILICLNEEKCVKHEKYYSLSNVTSTFLCRL